MLGTVLSRRGNASRAETLWNEGVVVRMREWPHDPTTAFLTLQGAHDAEVAMPNHRVISSWLDRIRDLGYAHVRTSAVSSVARRAFEAHGFTMSQELTLLAATSRDTDPLIARAATTNGAISIDGWSLTRLRVRRAEHRCVLHVDESAFGRQWSLDHAGLRDAFHATPRARIFTTRSRLIDGNNIDGYVVAGATSSGQNNIGFIQRLAVHAAVQQNGLGKLLLRRALQWLSTQGCGTVYVNTEQTNDVALSLYRNHGFRTLPHELSVLECKMTASTS